MIGSIENQTLARLRDGGLALGMIVRIGTGIEIARIAASTDHDFLFVDMQHGAISIESAAAISQAALGIGVTPLVRVSSPEVLEASRLLDNGAMGIVAPDIETAEAARRLVAACRFPPEGARSVGAGYPQLGYRPVPIQEATRQMNDNILVVAMIESAAGVANAEAIAEVDGIDVLHIGSNDLMTAVGRPGEIGSAHHVELSEQVAAACRRHGKFFGIGGVREPEQQARFLTMGARFMTTNSDLAFLMSAAGERTRQLRGLADA